MAEATIASLQKEINDLRDILVYTEKNHALCKRKLVMANEKQRQLSSDLADANERVTNWRDSLNSANRENQDLKNRLRIAEDRYDSLLERLLGRVNVKV